jgi:hypothetical protein
LMPVLDNLDRETSIVFLKKVIERAQKGNKELLIYDRLFFTHIFRTGSTLENFREIENLVQGQSLLAFLKIDESKIQERIANARRHRDGGWGEYVDKKGNEGEICEYYLNQQKRLLELVKKTSIKNKVYDTTIMEFESIADDILKMILKD